MDHGIEHRDAGAATTCSGSPRSWTCPALATNDLHYTYAEDAEGARGAAVRADRQDAGRPEPVQVRRAGLLPQVARRRCARSGTRVPRGLRQHAADRRAGATSAFTEGAGPDAPRSRCRTGETEESWLGKEVERGLHQRFPDGVTDAVPQAGRVRARRHHPDGLPGLLPGRRRPRASTPSGRHPGRPRPRLGRRLAGRLRAGHHRARPDRAQAALRAVPQPRAHLDARHRHGLRRAPARRHDPLRHREVRRGPGRADHHLRHDQGEGRDQGLRAGASATRLRDGRPDHQGHAAAR